MTLKAQLKLLAKLQSHEFEAQHLQNLLNEIPQKLEAFENQKKELIEQLKKAELDIDAQKKHYREMELGTQEDEIQVQKSKEKLAIVKTNKEYQSSLKEIDDMMAKIGDIEEEMIELLEQIETAEKEFKSWDEEVQLRTLELDQAVKRVQHEQKGLQQQLAICRGIEKELRLEIPNDLLGKYEHLHRLGVKTAVAPVIDAVCKGCHMTVPPQLFIELQRFKDLTHCPHCQCIVYWEPAQEKEE